MKSYLDLIAIQGRVNKRKSRMTRVCIFLSVFLIMSLFGMADMEIRSQKIQAIQKDGSWHAVFQGLSKEEATLLDARPEVALGAWYDVINYEVNEGWQIKGMQTVICGLEQPLEAMLPAAQVIEGDFPEKDEILCTDSIQERLGVSVGDRLTVTGPTEETYTFVISGFIHTTSMLTRTDALGVCVNMETFSTCFSEESEDSVYYVQFVPYCNIQKTIADICEQFGLSKEQVGQNAYLLGLMFQSGDSYLVRIYLIVGILALLVAITSILMITGSLNSSVAQRTEFFGLMRCLGATPCQIGQFVRKEAIGWCKTAIPAALLTGTVVIWCMCGMLRLLSPHLFAGLPVFGVSLIGILAGVVIGLSSVWLAARTPAKKASKVSPLAAVSGNAGTIYAVKKAANTRFFSVASSLGIHHAKGSRKNFFLMSGSFAFSILLFLSFGTLWDFMGHALTPLRPSSPDLSVISEENACSIPLELAGTLSAHPAVKKVYGRSFAYEILAKREGWEGTVMLISYEQHQFDWAKKDLSDGSIAQAAEGRGVLAAYQGDDSLETGDIFTLQTKETTCDLVVSGILTRQPFDAEANEQILFCSEALFQEITGESGYTILDVQLKRGSTDTDAAQIRALCGDGIQFSDKRFSNMEVMGAYYAFVLFLYGFLAVILMISAFHMINSMSMSVSARIGQYQSLYAIGMSGRQILKMIAFEAFTYFFFGSLFGVPLGLWSHWMMYRSLITSRWGDPWYLPIGALVLVLFVLFISTIASLLGPLGRIRFITCNPRCNEL